jgi:hypothetical protein
MLPWQRQWQMSYVSSSPSQIRAVICLPHFQPIWWTFMEKNHIGRPNGTIESIHCYQIACSSCSPCALGISDTWTLLWCKAYTSGAISPVTPRPTWAIAEETVGCYIGFCVTQFWGIGQWMLPFHRYFSVKLALEDLRNTLKVILPLSWWIKPGFLLTVLIFLTFLANS